MKELIIIGGGPAGITAAIYAARKKMDFTMIGQFMGGQAAWSGDVENYTGYQFVSGPELAIKFKQHLEQFKIDLQEGVEVKKVEQAGQDFKVTTSKNETLLARTVIIASGKRPRLLNIPGEAKYKNKGLTYCATCDGPIFTGKDVAVIGGGNSGLDAALQLMKYTKKVYLINTTDKLTGDAVMQEKVKAAPNVEVLNNSKTLEITGDKFVKGMKVETKGSPRQINVEGIFVEIGLIPNSTFIDFVKKDDKGEIIVNCAAETNVAGLFAAGDVTNVPEKQIIIAAGEGSKASLAAFKYLARH